jgi:cell division protein FtsL
MELVRERQMTQEVSTEREAHNAQISERYRKLQSAEADQLASGETNVAAQVEAPIYYSPASETPAMQQTPAVTDYVGSASALFTSEKFDRMEGFATEEQMMAPTYVEPAHEQATAVAERYALTPLAKLVMAIFAVVVVAMLSLIGVNSRIISKQKIQVKNLEQKREQLIEQHDEIQNRIQIAQSEESIRAWAESQGMVQAGN